MTSTKCILVVLLAWSSAARAAGDTTASTPASEYSAEDQAFMDERAAVGDDESIYVVQRRTYSKKGSFEITPAFFFSVNNKFAGYYGPALSVTYHIMENFGVEAASSLGPLFQRYYSDLVLEVRSLNPKLEPPLVELKQMTYFGTLSLQYSALYGKLVLNTIPIDYDFYLTAGFGLVATREACAVQAGAGCENLRSEIGYGHRRPLDTADYLKAAANLGGGARVFFYDFLGLKIELRDIVYADRATDASGTTTDIRSNLLVFLGLSFLL